MSALIALAAAKVYPFAVKHIVAENGSRYFRAEFGETGCTYAVKVVPFSDPPQFEWVVLTARNRELPCERADVDASSAEMDEAEAAVLAAEVAF